MANAVRMVPAQDEECAGVDGCDLAAAVDEEEAAPRQRELAFAAISCALNADR
jgi:hypothetical protein